MKTPVWIWQLVFIMPLGWLAACNSADSLFYYPDHQIYRTPAKDGLAFEEVKFKSADGTPIAGWFIPGKPPVRGTVLHFHGNAQNLSSHYSLVSWLPAAGYNLMMFDYRGFGASAGSPSRKGVYEDCVAAMNYLRERKDLAPRKFIVFGQSLGGALAISVVGNNKFDGIVGVVDESGFSSYADVASDHFSFVARLVVTNQYSPLPAAPKISPIPLLIIHGTADDVVPYYHAQKLFAAAHEPKELWTIPNGGHMAALGHFRKTMIPRLTQQFQAWTGDAPAEASATTTKPPNP